MAAIAFYTFGLLREEHDHPHNVSFHDMALAVFAHAEGADGFLWVHTGEWDGFPRFREPDRDTVAQTLSLWHDLPSVYRFAYREVHAEALRRRKGWFVQARWPTYVAWWVAEGQRPTWPEAAVRLEHLNDHGATPRAFDFKRPFDADGRPAQLQTAAQGRGPLRRSLRGGVVCRVGEGDRCLRDMSATGGETLRGADHTAGSPLGPAP